MRVFRNKILVKIIAMLCIFLTIMNFGMPNKVYADWGGVLITPITLLLTSIADGIIGLIHKTIQYQDITLVRIAGAPSWWEEWGETALYIVIVAAIVVVAVAATIASAGTAAIAAVGLKALIIPAVKVSLTIGAIEYVTVKVTGTGAADLSATFLGEKLGNWFGNTIYMPVFTLTPEEIFANKIAVFDVNFFNPNEYKEQEQPDTVVNISYKKNEDATFKVNDANKADFEIYEDLLNFIENNNAKVTSSTSTSSTKEISNRSITTQDINDLNLIFTPLNAKLEGEAKISGNSGHYIYVVYEFLGNPNLTSDSRSFTEKTKSTIRITDDEGKAEYNIVLEHVFSGWMQNNITYNEYKYDLEIKGSYTKENKNIISESTAFKLREIVSKWYFILRNMALLVLMLILIYIGIRIVIGSTAGQKAKYKERLMDWLVAMCLLFIMHYIMAFAMEMVERIIELVVNMGEPERFCRIYRAE